MAYVAKSIGRPAGGAGNPTQKFPTILIYETDDCESYPTRSIGVTTTSEDFRLKAEKKLLGIYATPSSIEIMQEAEGDADARGYRKGVKFEHPGNSQDIEDFVEYYSNKNIAAFVLECNGNIARSIGDPCNPLSMKVETTETKDGTKVTITLQQEVRDPYRILRITSPLPEIEGQAPIVKPESL